MIEYDASRYDVRADGTVWTTYRERPRAMHVYPAGGNGYLTVKLRVNGRRIGYKVHVLVAQKFLGPKPFDDAVVRHMDGDQTNCAASNLRYGTQKENIADKFRPPIDEEVYF